MTPLNEAFYDYEEHRVLAEHGNSSSLSRYLHRRYARLMELTDDDIREYQVMWKEEFGEDISAEDARRSAAELIELFRMFFFDNPPPP